MGRALALYVQRWRALPESTRAQAIADGQTAKLSRSRATIVAVASTQEMMA